MRHDFTRAARPRPDAAVRASMLLAVFSFFFLVASAVSASSPAEYRHTLYIPVAQKLLKFEAPRGMCFLDRSHMDENSVYSDFKQQMQERNDQVLLAVFTPCDGLSGINLSDAPMNAGTITWLNPAVGETVDLSRADYLDMRESSMAQYAMNSPGYKHGMQPGTAHRTHNSVAIGLTGDVDISSQKQQGQLVVATTTLRQMPIEVTLRYTGKAPPLEKTYRLLDKFMAQQIALNE